jgi:hypothetical protein
MSLWFRNPDRIAMIAAWGEAAYDKHIDEFRQNYATMRQPDYPETFEGFLARLGGGRRELIKSMLFQRFCDMRAVGDHINKMSWMTISFTGPGPTLLTSDRPVICPHPLKDQYAYILMPISPTKLFLAVNDLATAQTMKSIPPKTLIKDANDWVVRQAIALAYGDNCQQLRFIENRLGRGTAYPTGPYGSS